MTSPLSLADERIARQREIEEAILAEVLALWGRVRPGNIRDSWLQLLPEALALLVAAQAEAVRGTLGYTASVLETQGINPAASATARPTALVGIASDGRTLDSLLYQPAVRSLTAIGRGAPVGASLDTGAGLLSTIYRTQIADAGRAAIAADTATRRHVGGYIRAIVGYTCGRCTVLAGKFFTHNEGFQRHPKCDCVHVPTNRDLAAGQTTDPKAYFDGLSKAEQDHNFTKAGAEAIRRGADIGQVVNARRGAYGLAPASKRLTTEERAALGRGRLKAVDIGGHKVYVTSAGLGRRPGSRVRLMPESILAEAGDNRAEALRLLKANGYIT